jgi:hypothetical protein
MARKPNLRVIDPEPSLDRGEIEPTEIDLGDGGPSVTISHEGVAKTEHPDGSVTFDDNPSRGKSDNDNSDFYRNLADDIDAGELANIASDLLTGIELDIDSRKEWMESRATGIRLLALKLEEPRGDLGTSSAPLEGMSTIRHPLLLEAVVHFQANALGELLPAAGPVKVRNDLPMRPDTPEPAAPPAPPMAAPPQAGQPPAPMAPPAPPPIAEGQVMDDLGAALEKDMNHYLTVTATEYVPDTDRMMFYVGFGGDGFKKVYNCPLRKRPVSESIDAEDLIVSNHATDLRNCGRVTHRIKMRPSILKRMQLHGGWRDVPLGKPTATIQPTAPEKEKAEIGGYRPMPSQPKDSDYEVYECYCELDLDDFAPKPFKGKGVPLPFVVTIEKESRQVLSVVRNWDEDDEQALAKQFFVQFPFIRGLGFYGIGLLHMLGNVTMALTAIWRIMIDNGMFSSFPGFLFAKGAGRQNTNQIRIPPGGGFPVDVPPGMKIQDAFMAPPYRDTSTGLANLGVHIEEVGQRLGQTAELQIGEGKQDVPVGTTMAMIEQATKIMDSVHKRLHSAQAQEFGLLKERFREDPEAFWRHNKRPARQWTVDQFKQAIKERELVPVADPNNPTSLHRIAKATIIDMLVTKYPLDMDRRAALKRIMRIADIDSDGLMNAQEAQPPPDPRMVAIQAKAQTEQAQQQIDQAKLQLEAQQTQSQMQNDAAERASKERQQQFEMQLEQLRVKNEMIIHAHDIQRDNVSAQQDMQVKQQQATHDIVSDHVQGQAQLAQDQQKHQLDLAANQAKHQQELQAQREQHAQQIQLEREKHAADLENQRKMAEAKAQAIGPAEQQKAQNETEAHKQSMTTNDAKLKMQSEKHKADLANTKKLTDAKTKAMLKPKPKPAGNK